MEQDHEQVTRLLDAMNRGDTTAADELFPLVYDELRERAARLMASERRDHTLQGTALVHEAYLKLVGSGVSYQSQLHFFNAAALAMRRILVDHAVHHRTLKRGGGRERVALSDIDLADGGNEPIDWLELDEALKKLSEVSPRQHQVVMLRFFAGRTDRETAQMLQISEPTVRRDWATARVWLFRTMRGEN